MKFDRTLLNDKHLIDIITYIKKHGYDLKDFEFSTQRTHSYKQGTLNPKAVIYVSRISTGVEISYVLGNDPDFSMAFWDDLKAGIFEK